MGTGTVYAFGTNLGAAAARGDETARAVVQAIVTGARRPDVGGRVLRPRLVSSEHGALLLVFNRHRTEQADELRFRETSSKRARNVVTGTTLPIHDGGLTVTVPGEDVHVFALEG